MTNPGYSDINQYRDVESINYYHILLKEGKSREEALEILGQRSRDNGRSPMQWDSGKYAGFSECEPWIGIPDNYKYINVAGEEQDPDSILNYYRKLIQLRKQYPVIQEGSIEFLYQDQPEVFAYRRIAGRTELVVVCNLTGREIVLQHPLRCENYVWLTGNDPQKTYGSFLDILNPYESVVFCTKE